MLSVQSYRVDLQLDDDETFRTSTVIAAQATTQTDVIVLHSRDLDVSQYVTVEWQKSSGVIMVSIDTTRNRAALALLDSRYYHRQSDMNAICRHFGPSRQLWAAGVERRVAEYVRGRSHITSRDDVTKTLLCGEFFTPVLERLPGSRVFVT